MCVIAFIMRKKRKKSKAIEYKLNSQHLNMFSTKKNKKAQKLFLNKLNKNLNYILLILFFLFWPSYIKQNNNKNTCKRESRLIIIQCGKNAFKCFLNVKYVPKNYLIKNCERLYRIVFLFEK